MIDELDLAFDENAERGRPRHRRGLRGGKRGGRTGIAFVMAFVLLAVLGGGVWYGYGKVKGFFTAADYSGPGSGEAVVQVKTGDSATDIGNTLYTGGVVKSAAAFIDAAKDNAKSKNIQVGYYKLKTRMKAKDALAMLLDTKNLWTTRVTLPEGLSYQQTFDKLAAATKIPVANFTKAAKDPIALGLPAYWFNRTDGKKADKTDIEGFLYPDTYDFSPKADATEILKDIVGNFLTAMGELDFVNTVQKTRGGISPYQALIAASIAQAEAAKDVDMPKVARVLYNRAYSGKFPCNCLGLDSTVNYWLRITGKGSKASENLTKSELHDPKNPYDTYDKPGLPPGPIGNPGKVALTGAMNPTPNFPYFYFVAVDKNGTTLYAKTFADHQKNINVACKNGIPLCG
jgi:UPF0755 protein